MSAINFNPSFSAPALWPTGRARGASLGAATQGRAPAIWASAAWDLGPLDAIPSSGLSMAQIGVALSAPAQISNALATADDALGMIGALLSTVSTTLSAATANTAVHDQPSIDRALATIDRLAASTTFSGSALLDGTYSASLNGSTLALPSFLTADLSATAADGSTPAAPLSTLATGGINSLSGGSALSGAIVAGALDQVQTAREQIGSFRSAAIMPVAEAGQSSLEALLLASTVLQNSSMANTTALLFRAQSLLHADTFPSALSINADHVLALIK